MPLPQTITHYSIKDLWQQPIGESIDDTLELSPDCITAEVGFEAVSPGVVNLHLVRLADSVHVELEMTVSAALVCSRCAQVFRADLHRSDQYELAIGEEAEVDGRISRQLTIDLSQSIIDTAGLSVPSFPLHTPDCQGLCQICGADLNLEREHYQEHRDHKPSRPLGNSPKLV